MVPPCVCVWMDGAFQKFAEDSLFFLVRPQGDGFQRAQQTHETELEFCTVSLPAAVARF